MCSTGKILKVKGQLENYPIKYSLDSGASKSVISLRSVKKLKIKVLSSNIQIKIADNSIKKVIGETEPMLVSIGSRSCFLKFLIMDLDDNEVLLGLDWFLKTGAMISPIEKKLKFPGETLFLELNDDYFEEHSGDYEREELFISEVIDEEDIIDDDWPLEDNSPKINIYPEHQLSDKDYKLFRKSLSYVSDLFAYSINDLKSCNKGKHKIKLIQTEPIRLQPYRKSYAEREQIKQEIPEMLENGIIEPSTSPWASPVLIIPKKDGTKRFCVDYRKLNSITITENWPLPRIEDILDRLSGSIYFTTLDLKAGYWQIEMDEDSKEYTAFTTPDGHYQFMRMPFGLKNAPAQFSKLMHQIFGVRVYVEIYLDDIIIHSKTAEDHVEHIRIAASLLRNANLKIKPSKCTWFARKTKILGHIVSGDSIEMEDEKVEAVKKRQPPKNIKQLQSFLGLCNYYRKFIKNYAEIAAPMFKLLKTDKFVWSEPEQKSFEALKKALISKPILRQPNFSRKFILHTDASSYAIGAVLTQVDENGNEYVVSYNSRLLKNAEIHYGITEKECLSVVWAIKKYRVYLYGTNFDVITDHSALKWLMNITDPTARLARWAIYLQAYEFKIIHRIGISNGNADALSRPVLLIEILNQIEKTQSEDISPKYLDVYEDDNLMFYLINGKI
ncbi:unnamed protein product [Brachionus calyciflorus]|uniref:RNA-directed DNA polymerase n=1 Tax=Brachionus calyciflorus TaxID=104777 RepID=A0A813MN31_9BILA|nr:unnamed protein product [Brachionus calyciflorus]